MSSADQGTAVHPVEPVPHKQKKQWITARSILILGTGAIALHLLQEFIFGPSAAGSFIANTVQIFCAGVAAAACFAATRRGTGFTRPFWLLIGFSFVVWAAANIGWMYYESYLQISPPRESFCHFLMDFRWIVLAMALLLDQNEDCPPYYFDPASLLDTLQLFIIFVLIYLGWYQVPSLHESRMLSLLRSDQIELSENFAVLTLAALQLIRARTAELRRLYGSFLLCFVPLTVGICITDYRELRLNREVPSGSWLDLWWTVPFLFAAWWAAHWEQTPTLFDTRRTEQRFVSMLFENTMYAGGPLIVLMQVAELGPEWRKTSFLLLGLSILGFGARLALSKFREADAMGKIRRTSIALVESEGRFRTLIEEAPLAISISRNAKTLWANRVFLNLFGYSDVQEVEGLPIGELLSSECRDEVEERARLRTLGEVVSNSFEITALRKDGFHFDAQFEVAQVQLPDGPATLAFVADVSQRKRAEKARLAAETALRRSEEHFRLLVEQASDGIFQCDSHGRYQAVNSAGAEMLGYTREELLQLAIPDIVVPEEVSRISPEVARFAGGAIVLSEWKFKRKDGSNFTGEVCGRQLPDGKLQAIVRDITERKRAEEALRQSEERFRVALKESPITVFNQDHELRYTWIYNPQLYWQHEVIGRTDDEVLGKKRAAELTALKTRVLQSGTAMREEVVIPVNGHSHVCDMTAEPLFDKERNVIGITGACMDIGWLRERADRLQESRDQIAREKAYLETQIQTELGFEDVIGQTPALREVLQKAQIVAPTDSTVLLLGETGTGKELIARSLHALSTRREKTFVKLNCAAVPSGLLESELFGHEKGAFTGAVSQKVGRIELADKGTLFLDEIGEMPLELQPKLLRVLQDREFERLGSVKTLHVDVRIISATNRDLQQEIADKKFREDLFYRLNVFPIEMPPLRERKEDIPMLVRHFVDKHSTRMGKHVDVVSEDIMQTLKSWNWPGNIRELENMIERMVILSKGCVLAAPPADLLENSHAADDHLTGMEREHIIRVLRETNGVLSGSDGAALRLGLKRTTLQSMMKRLGIEVHDYRNKGNGDSVRY